MLTLLAVAVAVLLTFLPLLFVLWFLSTTGTDTPSSDYIFSIGLIDRILSGTYRWSGFFRDTFIQGAHCMALPILCRLAVIRLTQWSIYGELYLTVTFFALRLFLLYDLLTFRTQRKHSLWLWPLLSALIFAIAQADVFAYGDAGLQIGLVQLGLTLGLWGLIRFSGETRGVVLAALGGLIATWSGGGGLITWPVLLAGLIAGGGRRAHYGLLVGAGALAVLPYALHLASPPSPTSSDSGFGLLPPNPIKFLAAIGYPLVYGMAADQKPNSTTITVGCLGVGLLALGLGLVWSYRRSPMRNAAVPALLLIAWGAVNILATTMLREGLLTWYSTSFLGFWVGLVGLVYAVWAGRKELPVDPDAPSLVRAAPSLWCAVTVASLATLYLGSNLTYGDKVMFFLPSRAPATAAAIRHYGTAPTYAEELVFPGFSLGHANYVADLAHPLDKHGLSQFSLRRQWILQGEFVLDHVRLQRGEGGFEPYWSSDRGPTRDSCKDYHHLDLVVPPGASTTWRVRLPRQLRSAELRTGLLLPAQGSPGVAEVTLTTPTGEVRELFRGEAGSAAASSLRIPVTDWAGQEVEFRLTGTGGAVVFRYPVLDLMLREREPAAAHPALRPSNLDPADLPAQGAYVFDMVGAGHWIDANGLLGAVDPAVGRSLAPDEFIRGARPADRRVADYDRAAIRITAGPGQTPADLFALRLIFVMRQGDGTPTIKIATLTLLADGKPHTYTYPLRLLEVDPEARLVSFRLLSVSKAPLRLHDLRLVTTASL